MADQLPPQDFYSDILERLVSFVQALDVAPVEMIVTDPVQLTIAVGYVMDVAPVANPDSREWMIDRMGCLIGNYFAKTWSGVWHIDDFAGSPHRGRIMVCGLKDPLWSHASLDPFRLAEIYVDAELPRDLWAMLKRTAELAAAARG